MMRVNRYRRNTQKPKQKKVKRERNSKPLPRSVHIEGRRWGWEYASNRERGEACECRTDEDRCIYCKTVNRRVKILSPDNKYFEIKAEEFETKQEWPCGQKYIDTRIRPGAVKQYVIDNLIERAMA